MSRIYFMLILTDSFYKIREIYMWTNYAIAWSKLTQFSIVIFQQLINEFDISIEFAVCRIFSLGTLIVISVQSANAFFVQAHEILVIALANVTYMVEAFLVLAFWRAFVLKFGNHKRSRINIESLN